MKLFALEKCAERDARAEVCLLLQWVIVVGGQVTPSIPFRQRWAPMD